MKAYMIYRKGYGWVDRQADDYAKMNEGALFSSKAEAESYLATDEDGEVVVKVTVTRDK